MSPDNFRPDDTWRYSEIARSNPYIDNKGPKRRPVASHHSEYTEARASLEHRPADTYSRASCVSANEIIDLYSAGGRHPFEQHQTLRRKPVSSSFCPSEHTAEHNQLKKVLSEQTHPAAAPIFRTPIPPLPELLDLFERRATSTKCKTPASSTEYIDLQSPIPSLPPTSGSRPSLTLPSYLSPSNEEAKETRIEKADNGKTGLRFLFNKARRNASRPREYQKQDPASTTVQQYKSSSSASESSSLWPSSHSASGDAAPSDAAAGATPFRASTGASRAARVAVERNEIKTGKAVTHHSPRYIPVQPRHHPQQQEHGNTQTTSDLPAITLPTISLPRTTYDRTVQGRWLSRGTLRYK